MSADPDFVPDDAFVASVRHGVATHRRRTRRRFSAALALVAVLAGSGVWYANDRLDSVQRIDLGVDPTTPDPLAEGEPFNLLVVGTDGCQPLTVGEQVCAGRTQGQQLADAISVLHVDPTAHTIDLLSIPRDLWLDDRATKINALPVDELTAVLDERFGLPIDHFGAITFAGVVEIATAIDLRLDPGSAIRDRSTGLDLPPGCQVVSGQQVLALVRSRHLEFSDNGRWLNDPTGDLGRISRRTAVVTAALSQLGGAGASISTINQIANIVSSEGAVDAGLSNADIVRLAKLLASSTMRSTATLPTIAGGTAHIAYQGMGPSDEVNQVLAALGGRYDGPASPTTSVPGTVPAGITPTVGWTDIAGC